MSVCDAASQTPTGGQAVTAQLIVVSVWAAGKGRSSVLAPSSFIARKSECELSVKCAV